MTEKDIAGMTPAFASYLGQFRDCFPQKRTMAHFDNYCRGLLSDLPRKSIEPMALASGTAVRTLQEFLSATRWDQELARNLLQQDLAARAAAIPDDALGAIGVIDETSCRKWGDQTPGVQRQYLGCVGKVDNGIVTVHVGLAKGRFQTLLDADLYLPESWDQDRERCHAAGIPAEVRYRPKWRIALDQVVHLSTNGVHFDWLTFDEGYGAAVPFLHILNLVKQRFVAEVPVNFMVCNTEAGPARRADERLSVTKAKKGRRYRLKHQTVKDSVWRAVEASVWVEGHSYRLIAAINEATAEVKYFLTNATDALARVLAVAFRRYTVEHSFRLAKQEAGLMHYEGRHYLGLIRHLMLALVVLGFVATHTERLRGEKSTRDRRAGVPSAEPTLRGDLSTPPGDIRNSAHEQSHSIPPASKLPSNQVPQETPA
jgi:SRSO17 transposase